MTIHRDLMKLPEVPTVYPTETEFLDPISYLSEQKIQRLGSKYGMVKLVPPASFKPPLMLDKNKFTFNVRLQKLNELHILNRSRLFFIRRLNNFNISTKSNGKPRIIKKSYILVTDFKVYLYDLYIEIIKYFNQDLKSDDFLLKARKHDPHTLIIPSYRDIISNHTLWKQISKKMGKQPVNLLRQIFDKYIKEYFEYLYRQYKNQDLKLYSDQYPKSLLSEDEASSDDESDDDNYECLICHEKEPFNQLVTCKSCLKYFHVSCVFNSTSAPMGLNGAQDWICKNCIIGNGSYGFKMESKEYTISDFENQYLHSGSDLKDNSSIDELEHEFWRLVNNIDGRKIVKYGADIHNTEPGLTSGFPVSSYIPENCMDKESYLYYANHPANLTNLPYAKGSLLPLFKDSISGMTIPWMYVGSQFSTFCWHMEDQYTLSANYQHEGAPKVWYSIPASNCEKFQNYLTNLTPDLFKNQPDMMHQLTSLVSPRALEDANVSCYRAIQHPNEYIITYPKCYHSGFNSGYNLNEAVNFTTNFWYEFGLEATVNYKKTGKQCVFDMSELSLVLFKEYLKNNNLICNESLVRLCYATFLKDYNRTSKELNEMKNLKGTSYLDPSLIEKIKLEDKEINRVTKEEDIYEDEDEYIEDDNQVYCTDCRTICSELFVVHFRNQNSDLNLSEVQLTSPNEWHNFLYDLRERTNYVNFEALCLPDYLERLHKINDQNVLQRKYALDRVYLLKHNSETYHIVQKVGDKLDGRKINII